jgi:hypothetical protein
MLATSSKGACAVTSRAVIHELIERAMRAIDDDIEELCE